MKKLVSIILVILLVTLVPICSFAAGFNYANMLQWNKGFAGSITSTSVKSTYASGIGSTYASPTIDILPAVKMMVFGKDRVTVEISFSLKGEYSGGKDGVTGMRAMLRGRINVNALQRQTWHDDYNESLKGDPQLFELSGSNEQFRFEKGEVYCNNKESTSFTLHMTVTKNQINSNHIKNWYFCFDGIDINSGITGFYIENFSVSVGEQNGQTGNAGTQTKTAAPQWPVRTNQPQAQATPNNNQQITVATPVKTAEPTAQVTPTPVPTESHFYDQPLVTDMVKVARVALITVIIVIVCIGGISFMLSSAVKKK